jgi:copper chaperone CopZ
MSEIALQVDGLSCGGCVGSLTKRLDQVDGVTDVSIDLVSGGTSTVHVRSDGTVAVEDLYAAVTAAGKRLVEPAVA